MEDDTLTDVASGKVYQLKPLGEVTHFQTIVSQELKGFQLTQVCGPYCYNLIMSSIFLLIFPWNVLRHSCPALIRIQQGNRTEHVVDHLCFDAKSYLYVDFEISIV